MRRARRRRWVWLIGSVLILGCLATLWAMYSHERTLIELAQPITPFDAATPEDGQSKEASYWLSANQLVIVTTDHAANQAGAAGVDGWHGHADLLSLISHKRIRVDGLTRLLNKPGIAPWDAPSNFELSPNGTRLHWYTWYSREGRSGVARLDGSQYREWNKVDSAPNFWMDDQHYVEGALDRSGNLLELNVHDACDASTDRRYSASSESAKFILKRYRKTLPPDRLLVLYPGDATHYLIQMGHYWDGERLLGIRSYYAPIPKGANPIEQDASPLLTAIVYHVRTEQTPPIMAWLHRFVPFIVARPDISEGLWFSRIDGTGMREIGKVLGAQSHLTDIQWLPDDRHISFVYRGMLYLLPIEAQK